jgi:hypothetical protein
MKERHFTRQLAWTSNQGSQQMLDLRREKMMINPLLRYCSLIIFGSYLLTLVSGINLSNHFVSPGVTICFIILSIISFLCLVLVQNKFSERNTEGQQLTYHKLTTRPLSGNSGFRKEKRAIMITGTLIILSCLLLTRNVIFQHTATMIAVFIAGLTLYFSTLMMIRKLLIQKCLLRQQISAMHQKLLISADNRNHYMSMASSQISQSQQ